MLQQQQQQLQQLQQQEEEEEELRKTNLSLLRNHRSNHHNRMFNRAWGLLHFSTQWRDRGHGNSSKNNMHLEVPR